MSFERKEYQCEKCYLFWNATEQCVKENQLWCPYCGTKQTIEKSERGVEMREYTVKLMPDSGVKEIIVYADDKDEAENVVRTLINENILQNVCEDDEIEDSDYEIGDIERN